METASQIVTKIVSESIIKNSVIGSSVRSRLGLCGSSFPTSNGFMPSVSVVSVRRQLCEHETESY